MEKGDYLTTILRCPKTVFTYKDVLLLWGEPGSEAARVRLNHYVKNGDLYRIRRGLYAKDKNYNKAELATRIFTPSYVSFETVLSKEGVIFQFHSSSLNPTGSNRTPCPLTIRSFSVSVNSVHISRDLPL